MHYPWWYVPGLTSPMLIAIIAVLHVIVSHYAVGGGIILARENAFALKTSDSDYRKYWKKHLKFFVLLTVVYGAITGVGIWWTIGLASPLATEVLIRTFVFGWAIEWVFFIIEVVAAFAFYYYWDKLPAKTHSKIGWIYALAAWISLVLISGITAFMLNCRSLFGPENADPLGSFWSAFFNVQFLPQTIARTGGALVLATFYVYLHAAWTEKEDLIREQIVRRMRVPSFIGILMMAVSLPFCIVFLPQSSLMMFESASSITLLAALFAAVIIGALILFWFGPFRAPDKMGTGLALALFIFGVAGIGIGEFIREAVRKPFIVDQIVYSNQILPEQVLTLRQHGLLAGGTWTRLKLEQLQKKYPAYKILAENSASSTGPIRQAGGVNESGVDKIRLVQNETSAFTPTSTPAPLGSLPALPGDPPSPPAAALPPNPSLPNSLPVPDPSGEAKGTSSDGANANFEKLPPLPPKKRTVLARDLKLDSSSIAQGNTDLLKIDEKDQLELGRMIFLHHCNDCHSDKRGYSAAAPMLTGKTQEEIQHFLIHLNRPGYFMPPWCGTATEAELLAKYLVSVRPEMPDNIFPRPVQKETGKAPLPLPIQK